MKRRSQVNRSPRSKRGLGVGFGAVAVSVLAVVVGRVGPDSGRASQAAEDAAREIVVTLDLSQGRGKDTERLLLAEGRSIILVDGSRYRVEDLRVGQWIRLADGRVGLVTELQPETRQRLAPGTTPASACFQARRVVGTSFHTTDTLVTIRTPHGRVDSTPDHPFMSSASGWTAAGGLTPGDRLVTRSGGVEVPVESVEARSVSAVAVYNLTIDEAHAYFVGPEALLVHNAGGCGSGPSGGPSTKNENRAQQEIGTPPGLTGVNLTGARAAANAKFKSKDGFVQFSEEEWSEVEKALLTLETSPGVKGGRSYGNNGKPPLLPEINYETGKWIKYYEYDLSPHDGPRDGKRLVIGDDGSAYITGNHYHGFMPIREGSWKGWRLAWGGDGRPPEDGGDPGKRALQQYGDFDPTPTNQ